MPLDLTRLRLPGAAMLVLAGAFSAKSSSDQVSYSRHDLDQGDGFICALTACGKPTGGV